jgi:3-hydroxyisobutyrate dehydrogenase-like beta-hydroxyacid dehydrogenase
MGLMGKPKSRNLLKAGYPLVVYNRTRAKAADLEAEGATVAGSVAELAAQADVVCSCVTGPADVAAVYLGPEGVIAAARPGTLLIDMSTIDPATQRRVAAAAAENGCEFLDAPVTGGVGGARDGTLAIMCGGDPATFERARPVLAAMGTHLTLCGPHGMGATAKLINNFVSATASAALCEGLVMCAKAGVDPGQFLDIYVAGPNGSRNVAGHKLSVLKRDFEPGFTVDNMEKDVSLAWELARELGVRFLTGSITAQILREAQLSGLGDRHTAAQIIPMERLAGVEVKERARPGTGA